jgi:hypothetical protein
MEQFCAFLLPGARNPERSIGQGVTEVSFASSAMYGRPAGRQGWKYIFIIILITACIQHETAIKSWERHPDGAITSTWMVFVPCPLSFAKFDQQYQKYQKYIRFLVLISSSKNMLDDEYVDDDDED